MQKTIKIVYENEKKIVCASKELDFSSMTITAQKLFDLLDYSVGDTYLLEHIDFTSIDKRDVDYIQPIYNLISNLVCEINRLNEDSTLKQKENTYQNKIKL